MRDSQATGPEPTGPGPGGPGAERVRLERRALECFSELVEQPPAERAAELARLRQSDAALADEVQALLRADGAARPFPQHHLPAVDQLVPDPGVHAAGRPHPERVGRYTLQRLIGQGGMGVVFEALQDKPSRRVALKMLRVGLDSDTARRRFEEESEILAGLDHPAIARIFEAGVHHEASLGGMRELPYFVLEFVEGARTVVAYAREEELGPRARLELFGVVCDAVQHAHARGVIHRDLKPANVLVGQDGVPKVIDFGVARRPPVESEADPCTRTSELLGTLAAMSPEQLTGDAADLDARCDVYALGVLLYELLTGRPPLDLSGLALHEATRRIIEDAPPSMKRDGVPRALETITRTALAKRRGERYAGAGELAQDLRRYLRHEPIRARPVGWTRRLALFTRRHRTGVLAGLAGLGSLTLALWLGVRESERRDQAVRQAASLERALVDFNDQVTFGFLDDLERRGDSTLTRAEMIRSAIAHLESLEGGAGGDRAALVALARAHRRLGDMLGHPQRQNLGEAEDARRSLLRARELLEQLLADDPRDLGLRIELVRTEFSLAAVARGDGDPSALVPELERAFELCEDLLAEAPRHPDVRWLWANLLYLQGASQHTRLQPEEGPMAEAEAILRELLDGRPQELGLVVDLAFLLFTRADANLVFGRLEEASQQLDESAELFERALEASPGCANYRFALVMNATSREHLLQRLGEPAFLRLALMQETLDELDALRLGDPHDQRLTRKSLQLHLAQSRALFEVWEEQPGDPELEALRDSIAQGAALVEQLEAGGMPAREGPLGRSQARLAERLETLP